MVGGWDIETFRRDIVVDRCREQSVQKHGPQLAQTLSGRGVCMTKAMVASQTSESQMVKAPGSATVQNACSWVLQVDGQSGKGLHLTCLSESLASALRLADGDAWKE